MKWSKALPLLFLFTMGAVFCAQTAAEPSHVFLFSTSYARAMEGLARQRARNQRAQEELRRYSYLFEKQATSQEMLETAQAGAALAGYDLRIAGLRAKQASISLTLAQKLSTVGRPIPLCKRVTQSDENTTSDLLKKLISAPPPLPKPKETNISGSKVYVPYDPTPPPQEEPPPEPEPSPGPKPLPNPGDDGGTGT